MVVSVIVFICEQNATVRLTQKARDHLHPTEETRSVRLKVYTCVDTQQAHTHTAFGVLFRLSYVSFWASESAVPHSASPQGEDQGAIIESFDRGQQRNRYVLCNSVSTLFLLSLLLAHFLSQ